jgi:thiol:disulfide interchange protein
VLVFAALGLGLALPFIVIAFIPWLRRWLPKPGPWMRRFQQFLAIPMAASAAAALWLLYRQGGLLALGLGLAAVLGLGLLLFGVGRRQRGGAGVIWAVPASVGLAALLIFATPQHTTAGARTEAGAEVWSEATTARYLEQGKPVFVYFTADWCLTCKANEAAAIDRAEVRDAFRNAGVAVLAGDWTNGDPAITRFLESRGRAGVPLYLWYAPGKEAEELPQILTPAMLISRAQQVKR